MMRHAFRLLHGIGACACLLISACAGVLSMLLPTALLLHFGGAAPQPRFVADGASTLSLLYDASYLPLAA
jgi:hypothetical protein